jgi:hypothetical protein
VDLLYVCMYVCMYVCTYVFMGMCTWDQESVLQAACSRVAHADAPQGGGRRATGCMYVCTYVCMHVDVYVCMHVCMYVNMYMGPKVRPQGHRADSDADVWPMPTRHRGAGGEPRAQAGPAAQAPDARGAQGGAQEEQAEEVGGWVDGWVWGWVGVWVWGGGGGWVCR